MNPNKLLTIIGILILTSCGNREAANNDLNIEKTLESIEFNKYFNLLDNPVDELRESHTLYLDRQQLDTTIVLYYLMDSVNRDSLYHEIIRINKNENFITSFNDTLIFERSMTLFHNEDSILIESFMINNMADNETYYYIANRSDLLIREGRSWGIYNTFENNRNSGWMELVRREFLN